jgi:PAS domain S-box-containing protein
VNFDTPPAAGSTALAYGSNSLLIKAQTSPDSVMGVGRMAVNPTPDLPAGDAFDALLQVAAAESSSIFWIADGCRRLTWCCPELREACGFGPLVPAGTTFEQVFGGGDGHGPLLAAHDLALAGEPATFDLEWNGASYLGRTIPLAPRGDGAAACIGWARRLDHETDTCVELELLFNHSLQMLCIAGVDGYFRRLNPAFEATLGFTRQELMSRPFIDFVHPYDRSATLRELARLGQGHATVQFENRYLCKDGSYRWLSWTSTPAHRGQMVYACALDITYRKRLEISLAARDAELVAAKHIQEHLLPKQHPTLEGWDIAAMAHPAEFAAGDHYDFIMAPDGSLCFEVSDVTGHGFSSALLMGCTHSYLHAYLEAGLEIDDVLTRMSAALFRETEPHRFVTMFLGKLDPVNARFTYANAGHPPGFIMNRRGEMVRRLHATNIPLGLLEDATYHRQGPLALEPGDLLVVLTDGVHEAQSPSEELFEEERVVELVRENRERPAQEILDVLHVEIHAFTQRDELEDDVTAMVMRYTGI